MSAFLQSSGSRAVRGGLGFGVLVLGLGGVAASRAAIAIVVARPYYQMFPFHTLYIGVPMLAAHIDCLMLGVGGGGGRVFNVSNFWLLTLNSMFNLIFHLIPALGVVWRN